MYIQPPEIFCKKIYSRKIRKIHRKAPVPESSFLIKLLAEPCNFFKRKTLAQVFFCGFCEISKNNFFTEHLRATAKLYSYTQTAVCVQL